ncbi:MAG: hypothetical protein JXA14_10170 [Anaerolineae bacterium]|nr:hypothetical protein [Anaerolineae bacterium]
MPSPRMRWSGICPLPAACWTLAEDRGDTGFATQHAQELQELAASDPESYERVMKLILDSAGDSSLLGSSIHLLYVGRKSTQAAG